MLIYLLGFMGSGKSTLAKKIANKLNIDFLDLDASIVSNTKLTIDEIFETHGEVFFRETEQKILKDTFKLTHTVIACGGGTPCYFDNMEQMNKNGKTIYLKMPAKALYQRLQSAKELRPLVKNLTSEELLNYIETLLEVRSIYYNQAQITVNGLSVDLDTLLKIINKN